MDTLNGYFVGLDVGGTTMKAGVVDDAGRLLSKVSLPTEPERGQDHGLATMAECIRQAVVAAKFNLDQIAAIGVATPGSMDILAGVILDPPNLKPWRNVPVKQYIADSFDKPTAFQNDANAAAYGEYWVGIGSKYKSLVLFTLGTGIGGGIIIDGKVLEGAHSHGGELGQTKIMALNGRLCGCGQRGCLEAYASATAVVQRAQEALSERKEASTLRSTWQNQGRLTCKDVFDVATSDPLAQRIVDETAYFLGVGAANVMHSINPELICFSGGMAKAGPAFLNSIRRHAKSLAFPLPAAKTVIEYATLGTDAGIIGAAGCARAVLTCN